MINAEAGGCRSADRAVGVVQPLVQQWLQLAHVLEGKVQGLEPRMEQNHCMKC